MQNSPEQSVVSMLSILLSNQFPGGQEDALVNVISSDSSATKVCNKEKKLRW